MDRGASQLWGLIKTERKAFKREAEPLCCEGRRPQVFFWQRMAPPWHDRKIKWSKLLLEVLSKICRHFVCRQSGSFSFFLINILILEFFGADYHR